jgi:hypothetical protein
MAFILHNSIIYNAAYAAYIAGAGKLPTPYPAGSSPYTAVDAQASAFAQAVDAQIVNDATISGPSGIALSPTTAVIIQHQLGKEKLIFAICKSAIEYTAIDPANTLFYATVSAQILVAYTEYLLSLEFPAS